MINSEIIKLFIKGEFYSGKKIKVFPEEKLEGEEDAQLAEKVHHDY